MIPAVRQEKILELLSNNDIVSTDSLMQALDVSVSTLRRDLVKLEEKKLPFCTEAVSVLCRNPSN